MKFQIYKSLILVTTFKNDFILTYQQFTSVLKAGILSATYDQQSEFALVISKKLFFNYQKFYEQYNWGNPDILLDGILLFESEKALVKNINNIQLALSKIETETPDMDDFGDDYLGSVALNASSTIYDSLQFLIDKDPSHIYSIATYYSDTVDFQIRESMDILDDEIEKHPLMIQAWDYLIELIGS